MKHIIAVCLIFVLCFLIIPSAFAIEVDGELPEGWRYVDTEENLALAPVELVQVTEPVTQTTELDSVEIPILEPLDIGRNILAAGGEVSVTTSVSPITPSNTNGLKKVMVELIGNYDPVVVEYAYQSSQGYTSYLREVQPDYVWMISCTIFLVVLYSVFRIFGMVISWHK